MEKNRLLLIRSIRRIRGSTSLLFNLVAENTKNTENATGE